MATNARRSRGSAARPRPTPTEHERPRPPHHTHGTRTRRPRRRRGSRGPAFAMAPPGSWSVKNDAWWNSRKYWRASCARDTGQHRARGRARRMLLVQQALPLGERGRALLPAAELEPTISSDQVAPRAVVEADPEVEACAVRDHEGALLPRVRRHHRQHHQPARDRHRAPHGGSLRQPASQARGSSSDRQERTEHALAEQARAEQRARKHQERAAVAAVHQDPDDRREERQVQRLGPEELREARDLRIEQQERRGRVSRSRPSP